VFPERAIGAEDTSPKERFELVVSALSELEVLELPAMPKVRYYAKSRRQV